MKFIFAFLALLHFHQLQVQSNLVNPINGLIDRLEDLNTNSTINSTLSELQVPKRHMGKHTVCCVMKFKEITMKALSYVTVPAGHKCIGVEADRPVNRCVEEAKTLLRSLKVSERCPSAQPQQCTNTVKTAKLKKGPFKRHIAYLRALNLHA